MRSTVRWEQRSNRAASAVEILSLVKVLHICRLYDSYDILSRSKTISTPSAIAKHPVRTVRRQAEPGYCASVMSKTLHTDCQVFFGSLVVCMVSPIYGVACLMYVYCGVSVRNPMEIIATKFCFIF